MSTQFVHYLTGAAIGRYAATLLFYIMALQVPILLGLLIPIGFYTAILLSYGRLHAEREMVVLNSCGFSAFQLLKVTQWMALLVCLITALFSFWLSPMAAAKQKRIIEEAKTAPVIETLSPGRFFTTPDGRYILFVDSISRDHLHLSHLFLAEHLKSEGHKTEQWSIVTADTGTQVVKENREKYLEIGHGHRYQGSPGRGDFQVEQFEKYGIKLANKGNIDLKDNPQIMTTWELIKSGFAHPAIAAELEWRISSPLSVFVLALLAIPLSQVNPRQGRFAQLVPAALIYIIYANMMFMLRSWLENSIISPWFGVWWLHGFMLLFGFCLLAVQERLFQRWRFRLLS